MFHCRGLFCGLIIPDNMLNFGYIYSLWICVGLIGFCYGIASICLTTIIVDIMPKNVTGRVAGANMFIQYCAKGIGSLIVGLLWDISYQWLWYYSAICAFICLILLIIVSMVRTFRSL